MDLGLDARSYLVTAASGGLGFATARALVDDGARVVLVARREDALAERVAELGEDHAVALAGDLTDPELAERASALAVDRFGRLDGALVSVGGPPRGGVLDNDDEQWRAAFDSVFLAALRATRAVLGHATGEDTALAWVLSSSVKSPLATMAISNGLRPGLGMLVKQLADEIGPVGRRINALLPGSIATERMTHLLAGADDPDAARRATEATIALRRYGRPEEFGRVAAFLLSPAASYLTGSMYAVDGGALRAL